MLKRFEITPTLMFQCLGFMIGSTFFAVGSFGPVAEQIGSTASNILFFIGSWGFTSAAFVQLQLSGASRNERGVLRAVWLAAGTQFVGTILFNVSTGSAIYAESVTAQQDLVWAPDAQGSVLFLISGAFALLALARVDRFWGPFDRDWWSSWVNMAGCVAFGVSAVAAVVTSAGGVENASFAAWGTFVGAVCFFAASALVLPEARDTGSRNEA
ncbi:MAG: hypothetical protein M3Y23_02930 [Actinomycetota bacterium]|nr:hypothetical protein [Actinomycetota bacterium]